MRRTAIVLLAGLALAAASVSADVKTQEKSQLKFEGALGKVINFFGGRKTRDGVVTTVAVKGSRKVRTDGETGQIIDLAEEKIYEVDYKDKSYRVTTFAELIKQMQDARQKAQEEAARQQPETKPAEKGKEPEVEVDFDLKNTGQKRAINGFDTHEVLMTVTVRQKGQTLEQGGGFVTSSSMWLAPKVPAMQEIIDFDRKYAEKLLVPALYDPQQMAQAAAMYPLISQAVERMQKEQVKLDGMAILTTTKFEAVADAASVKQQETQKKQEESTPTGLAGLGGRLARRVADRNKDKEKTEAAPSQPGRATVMTFNEEILSVAPTVGEGDVTIPAGFKLKS
jgi:hypothetical protein